jgi:hypothetical protein
MLSINDLYDISAVFTRMRFEIRYDKNIDILQRMIKVMQINDFYEDNQIRNAIAEILDLDREKYPFVYHQNYYVHHSFLKNPILINLMIKICNELISAIASEQFEKAEDLADTVHCLPDIIAENRFTITKSYWKSHMRQYRQKWDKEFLKKEQYMLRSYNNRAYRWLINLSTRVRQ